MLFKDVMEKTGIEYGCVRIFLTCSTSYGRSFAKNLASVGIQ